jgi:hypothetical protein
MVTLPKEWAINDDPPPLVIQIDIEQSEPSYRRETFRPTSGVTNALRSES